MADNISIVHFLRDWMNGPIPQEIVSAGAEYLEMNEYTPEQRVHKIVTKCVQLWMEKDWTEADFRKAAQAGTEGER